MAINNFHGKTYVAFLDIAGFKEKMKDENEALKALDVFYRYGYNTLKNQDENNSPKVEGLFISDCGIIFVNWKNKKLLNRKWNESDCFNAILKVIKQMNLEMINNELMLTTAIAYGDFKYEGRIEFPGIGKNPIYGHAYVSAYIDTEKSQPKIEPGQCRIIKENLPAIIKENIQNSEDGEFKYIKVRKHKGKPDINHYYYYWMVDSPDNIMNFEMKYEDSYRRKYLGMFEALNSYTTNQNIA